MNFWDALQEFKKGADRSQPKVGIRCVSWGNHPTQRYISLTGINGVKMFGMTYYDFIASRWYRTWSVLMPTFYEAYGEWEIVPNDVLVSHDAGAPPFADDEKFIELMINYNAEYEEKNTKSEHPCKSFRQEYDEYINGLCRQCWQQRPKEKKDV